MLVLQLGRLSTAFLLMLWWLSTILLADQIILQITSPLWYHPRTGSVLPIAYCLCLHAGKSFATHSLPYKALHPMYQTAIRTSRSVGISARSSVSHVTGHPPVRHANSHVRTSSCRHNGSHIADLTPQQQALQTQQHWNKAGVPLLWQAAAVTLVQLHLVSWCVCCALSKP